MDLSSSNAWSQPLLATGPESWSWVTYSFPGCCGCSWSHLRSTSRCCCGGSCSNCCWLSQGWSCIIKTDLAIKSSTYHLQYYNEEYSTYNITLFLNKQKKYEVWKSTQFRILLICTRSTFHHCGFQLSAKTLFLCLAKYFLRKVQFSLHFTPTYIAVIIK